ncbi:DMT family transporter [Paraglaciecola sp.]|uniref:DMT family transporter n=1 Tax=Paraglaciecola sp. TaxID=1920173 RepID=UPI00273DEB04|nr:DMT family transporter [Paraglaciecola sp.]MDP5030140.1 DMT family transporter [Paraglaciecola sp.]
MPVKYAFELVFLAAIWGASFLFMRTTSAEFGPVLLITLRTGIAALVLLPVLLAKRQLNTVVKNWRIISVIGLTNTAIPFCLFSYSTLYLGAGYASVLNATAPMFGALIAFYWLKDRLLRIAVVGLVIGFVGVVVLSLSRQHSGTATAWLPILAALAATSLYGLAACVAKRYLQGVNALAITTGSQVVAAITLAPLSLFFWPDEMPSSDSWWQVVALGVLCTALAYILYFRLIANIGSAKAITVAYLVPVFGVLWGIIFLAERLNLGMWIGASLILLGVALTSGLFTRFRYIESAPKA